MNRNIFAALTLACCFGCAALINSCTTASLSSASLDAPVERAYSDEPEWENDGPMDGQFFDLSCVDFLGVKAGEGWVAVYTSPDANMLRAEVPLSEGAASLALSRIASGEPLVGQLSWNGRDFDVIEDEL